MTILDQWDQRIGKRDEWDLWCEWDELRKEEEGDDYGWWMYTFDEYVAYCRREDEDERRASRLAAFMEQNSITTRDQALDALLDAFDKAALVTA